MGGVQKTVIGVGPVYIKHPHKHRKNKLSYLLKQKENCCLWQSGYGWS